MSKIDEAILDHPALAKAIRGYGGRCRECADCEGICCNSGLPCDGGEARAAIEHVLRAVRYYSENPHFLDQIESDAALSAQPQSEAMATFEERGQLWSRWVGGSKAPSDWNGGRVLLASGEIVHPYQEDGEFDWRHGVSETGCLEPGCIVGYKSLSAQPQSAPASLAASSGIMTYEEALTKYEPQSEAGELADELEALPIRTQVLNVDTGETGDSSVVISLYLRNRLSSALRNQPAAGAEPACDSCGGLNLSCPVGCERDPETGELLPPSVSTAADEALERAAHLVENWNGETRDGDTALIADAIRNLKGGQGNG